eukprot:8167128-Ditylum_brightwellii.AAC.1
MVTHHQASYLDVLPIYWDMWVPQTDSQTNLLVFAARVNAVDYLFGKAVKREINVLVDLTAWEIKGINYFNTSSPVVPWFTMGGTRNNTEVRQ